LFGMWAISVPLGSILASIGILLYTRSNGKANLKRSRSPKRSD
jgi:hypothetical protein